MMIRRAEEQLSGMLTKGSAYSQAAQILQGATSNTRVSTSASCQRVLIWPQSPSPAQANRSLDSIWMRFSPKRYL